MAPLSTCVEWGYEKIVHYWAFVDFKKQMKLQGVHVEAMWHIAVFLPNTLHCAHGSNQISKYFTLPPPTLKEFLDSVMGAHKEHNNS